MAPLARSTSTKIVPAGMPPGTGYDAADKAPDGVGYFRVYATVMSLAYGGGMLVSAATALASMSKPSSDSVEAWLGGMFGTIACLVFGAPTIVALFGGRKPWVHTLGTLSIVLGFVSCMPAALPLLIVWTRPETRRWFENAPPPPSLR